MTRPLSIILVLAPLCLSPIVSHAASEIPQGPLPMADVDFDFKGFPNPGDIYAYKGHYIVGSSDPDVNNVPFFRNTKRAIDLLDQLPSSTQHDIKLIKAIMYNPPSANGKRHVNKITKNPNDAILDMYPAIYTFGGNIEQNAPMIVHKDALFLAPITIGYAFVSNSVYARLHTKIIGLRKRAKNLERSSAAYRALVKEHNALLEVVQKLNTASDLSTVKQYNCLQLTAVFRAMKAWKEPAQKISGIQKSLNERGCEY